MLVDPSSHSTPLALLKNTSPLRNQRRFWLPLTPLHHGNGLLGFPLRTVTSFHRPRLHHYYGFICHLAPTSTSSFLLYKCFHHPDEFGVRLPRLLHRPPVRDPTLKHSISLTEYWASRYYGRLPTNTAESGSLTLRTSNLLWLPSDPAVSQ